MSARRLFVPPDRLRATPITVDGDEHHHLARVLRARPGDAITLFDGAGVRGERAHRPNRPRPDRAGGRPGRAGGRAARAAAGIETPLTLLTAVPRGGRMDFLVQKCSELGVSRIVPVITARSVARPEPATRGRWEKIAREAARQCGRADVPVVSPPTPLAAALAASDLPDRRLMLSPDAGGRPLRALLARAGRDRAARRSGRGPRQPPRSRRRAPAGFRPVSLGSRILRVETAAIVAVALAEEAFGALSPAER